ncbi:MAG: hypothetical protein J0H43_01490, partial [Actinobacteria bacterium]|nr:hypothetical protein [Actinomycetota bacterium]
GVGSAAGVTPVTGTTSTGSTLGGSLPGSTGTTGTAGSVSGIGTSTGAGTGGGLGTGLGSLPGVTATPVHAGDTVGVLSVPVEISPTGQITPLLHTTAPAPVSPPATPSVTPQTIAPAHAAAVPQIHAADSTPFSATPAAGSGGGTGGGFGGGTGGGTTAPIPVSHATIGAPAIVHTVAATHAAPPTALASEGPGASHDGLYSGLGQATGIGAGAAALARATLHEARQRSEGGLLGAITLPFDAASDGAAQAHVFDGELA